MAAGTRSVLMDTFLFYQLVLNFARITIGLTDKPHEVLTKKTDASEHWRTKQCNEICAMLSCGAKAYEFTLWNF